MPLEFPSTLTALTDALEQAPDAGFAGFAGTPADRTPSGGFAIFNQLFAALRTAGGEPAADLPIDFGDAGSSWRDQVGPFYAAWAGFRCEQKGDETEQESGGEQLFACTFSVPKQKGENEVLQLNKDIDERNRDNQQEPQITTARPPAAADGPIIAECSSANTISFSETAVRRFVSALRSADPRYRNHMAATERRRQVAASGWGLTKEDRNLFAFLERKDNKVTFISEEDDLGEGDEGTNESDGNRTTRQTGDAGEAQGAVIGMKAKSRRAAKMNKATAEQVGNHKKNQDNFTKGQLLNEAPKTKTGRRDRGGQSDAGATLKMIRNRREGEQDPGYHGADHELVDQFADAINCATCKMDFTTEKKRQEHYRKFPDHNPEAVAAALVLAKSNDDTGPGKQQEKGNNKPKQKRHGHRKF